MNGHTKGPWKAVQTSHGPIDVFDANDHDVVTVYGGRMGNALLIAAAPELLEALQTLMASSEEPDPCSLSPRATLLVGAWAKARDAISKAEGRS